MDKRTDTLQKIKRWLKKWLGFFLNPHFLLCFGLAWLITNGWCYVLIALGGCLKIGWMLAVGTAYAGFLWLPGTPEKLVTLAISLFLLKRLFPGDEKTLKLLHEEREKLRNSITKQKNRRAQKARKQMEATDMGKEPALVIMAAGMGSRFGGMKQMTPVDAEGHFIIDFSLYDAYRAGFRKVVFIIKKEMEPLFREKLGDRMERYFEVKYVHQELSRLPEGFTVPECRVKPWGTGHAVACCKGAVDGPFAVINADDFYGKTAFSAVYDYLAENTDENQYAMVGYRLRNTVTEFGSVARGVCEIEDGLLRGITERTKIFKKGADAEYTEDGATMYPLPGETIVSMNLWGFTNRILDVLWEKFPAFLQENLPKNPEKCEFYLPFVVDEQLREQTASVRVLPCEEAWHGVTYREDLQSVVDAIEDMKRQGIYTRELWA